MSVDELRCNHLECRIPLNQRGQAVVTTCSHIFCVTCANDLFGQSSACPACQQELAEPGDIVSTFLNPSNEYKGTVLAGLSPIVIMEIAQRALSFWTYQMSQQSAFQVMLLKNQERVIAKKDQEVAAVQGQLILSHRQISDLQQELQGAKRRIRQLSDQARESEKESRQLRGRYDQVKRRALLGAIKGVEPVSTPPVAMSYERPLRPDRLSAQPQQGPRPFVATPVNRIVGKPMPRSRISVPHPSSENSDVQQKTKTGSRLSQRKASKS